MNIDQYAHYAQVATGEVHRLAAQLAERDAEIVELNRRFNAQSDNFVAASITIGQLRAEIAQLKAQVAELQANNAEDWHGRTGHDVM